jgi:methylmalonyl-CoA epimerase
MADGSVRKLHHVAVAVESVEQSLGFYRDVLGLTEIETMRLDDRGLHVALIKTGDSEIELLEPTTPDNTVRKFLDRRGPGLHHICFQVDDLERAIQELKGRGAEFIDDVPRPGAVGLVAFMPPSVADGVLVELTQVSGVGCRGSGDGGPSPDPSPGGP